MDVLLIGNDLTIELQGLQDSLTGDYINAGATVTVTVKSANTGIAIEGDVWPKTMTYVASSSGVYRATLEDGMALEFGKMYCIEISADCGSDQIAFWKFYRLALWRNS
jgi:hypothetical protein